jgi:hypothetical protein
MTARGSRQSFLGEHAQDVFASARVAVLGLGGGGSHIVQQLAHVGFQRFVLCDPDVVEDTNLNRLVGATERDAIERTRKIDVAARVIRGLAPAAAVDPFASNWQDRAEAVRGVDLVFGCLDGYAARQALEVFTRRYLLPLIDIGMDVHQDGSEPPSMSGQVILSMPGAPCMACIGFLNEITLAQEATKYGAAGIRPQVVWANGALASTAVGIAVNLLTGWTTRAPSSIYFEYDGNTGTLAPHKRLKYAPTRCIHYPLDDVEQLGDPVLREV